MDGYTQLTAKHILRAVLLSLLILTGCSSGDGGSSGKSGNDINGTAATGAPIAQALVEIKGADGQLAEVTTSDEGKYSVAIAGLTPPLLMRVHTPDGRALYSLAFASGVTNIHPLTDLVIRNWFAARDLDVTVVFDSAGPVAITPTREDISAIQSTFTDILQLLFKESGLATPGAAPYDFFATEFTANGNGFDGVLDQLQSSDRNGRFTVTVREPDTGVEVMLINRRFLDAGVAQADTAAPVMPASATRVVPASNSEMIVAWDAAQDNIGVRGYKVVRTVGGISEIFLTPYNLWRDEGLTAGALYCYRVQAIDGAGNESGAASASASEVCKTAADAVTDPLAAPVSLLAEVTDNRSVRLTWAASTDNHLLGYNVYRYLTGAPEVRVATVIGTGFDDVNLAPGINYCYTIRAFSITTTTGTDPMAVNLSAPGNETCVETFADADTLAPVMQATPVGRDYDIAQSVVLGCDDGSDANSSGAEVIYYSLDGSEPTGDSQQYTSPIAISNNSSLKSFCEDRAGNAGPVRTDRYIIDSQPPTSKVANTATGGMFADKQLVELSCDDGAGVSCTIYYTTDLSEPSFIPVAGSTVYSAPVSISTSTTLKFYAVDHLNQEETVIHVEEYIIDRVAPVQSTVAGSFINGGSSTTNSLQHVLAIGASDAISQTEPNGFVDGYCVLEKVSDTFVPAADAECWQALTTPLNIFNATISYQSVYSYPVDEVINISVWFRDSVGNVSNGVSDSILFSGTSDSPPLNTTKDDFINAGDIFTALGTVNLMISATDNFRITGYCIKDYAVLPAELLTDAGCWTDISPVASFSESFAYTLTGTYNHGDNVNVLVWFRDGPGNISAVASDTISFGDSYAPLNTTEANFINSGATETGTLSVQLALSATDNLEVTHYCLMENNTGVTPVPDAGCWHANGPTPNFSRTVSYDLTGTYASGDAISIFAWFSDAQGNISDVISDSIVFRDSSAPVNTTSTGLVNNGAGNTISTTLTLAISATDNFAVTDYCILSNDTGVAPAPDAGCWTGITPVPEYSADLPYNLTGYSIGSRVHVFVWFRDANNNVSDLKTGSISYADSQAPVNTTKPDFIDGGVANTRAASVSLALSATDDIAVTDYCARDFNTLPAIPLPDATCWTSIAPTSNYSATVTHNLTPGGYVDNDTISVLVWFRDAAQNVSTPVIRNIRFRMTPIPVNTTTPNGFINAGAVAGNLPAITLSLSATDADNDVDSYFVVTTTTAGTPVVPLANDPGWSAFASTGNYRDEVQYLIPGSYLAGDRHHVHVWFKDTAGNIADVASDDIIINREVYFADNFETGIGNWTVSGADWSIVTVNSVSQTRSATDSPGGNYAADADVTLTLATPLDLSGSNAPVLDYWTRFNVPDCPGDSLFVEVSVDGGNNWDDVNNLATADGQDNCDIYSTWHNIRLDLSGYKNTVLIRFRLHADSDSTVGDGWFIDDVVVRESEASVLAQGLPLSDDMEGNTSNWLLSGSDWTIDNTDSVTPGSSSFIDNPGAGFRANANSTLTLANPVDLNGSVTPVLSFWARYNVPDSVDRFFFEISEDGGLQWTNLYAATAPDGFYGTINWQQFIVDLSAYKPSKVLVRIRLRSDGDISGSLSLDNIEIREAIDSPQGFPFSDDFENGASDWWLDGSDWAVDSNDSSGAGSASLAVDLTGNSFALASAVFTLRVPVDLSSSTAPMLYFDTKYSLPDCVSGGGDRGYVQISSDGGLVWTTLTDGEFCDTAPRPDWSPVSFSLAAWKNDSVLIRFWLGANADGAGTWSVDNVEIRE